MVFRVGALVIGAYVCVRVIGGTALGTLLRIHTRRTLRRSRSVSSSHPAS